MRLLILIYLMNFCSVVNASTDKIPITTASKEAKKLYEKAVEFEGLLKTEEANQLYERALQLDSTFALAHIRLGMLKDDFAKRRLHIQNAMLYLNKISEGEKLWILARNNFYGTQDGKSEYDCFSELVKLYPNDENANYMFGFVHVHHGKNEPDVAIEYFKRAMEINPNISRHYNELAYAYMSKSDFINAEKIIKEYIEFLPNHENPRDTYAEMLMRNHRYQESIKAYRDVLKINQEAPWAHMGIAANLNFLNRFEEARERLVILDSITLSDYEYRHKWRAKVCSYLYEGKIDSAIVVLNHQKGESDSGKNLREPLFHQYMSLSRITRFYFENNQPDLGLKSYQNWENFTENNIKAERTIQNTLALEAYYHTFSLVLKNQLDEAQTLIDSQENHSEDFRLLQARIFIQKKQFNDAIAILQKLDSHNPYYLYWLYLTYQLNNQNDKSIEVKQQMLSLIEMNNLDYAMTIGFLNNPN